MKNKTIEEIINMYSETVKELKRRSVIRTNNITGDLGEYSAVEIINKKYPELQLELEPPSTMNYDAISKTTHKKYSIKSMTTNQTSIIDRVNNEHNGEDLVKLFDYLVLVKFNKNYEVKQIYILSWDKFIEYRSWHKTMGGWNLNLTMNIKNDQETLKVL